ncbi:MAG: preprotein translocase subunit SecG [Sedimentisphaerales bacterium]|nr:preprotein translocase subunit SecG [Sedimentisphaerales bacterium]
MISFPFLAVSFIMHVVAVLFVICCVALVLIILIQKGRGGGLSAAFGGGMASGILGSKTGDFLTWVTIVLVSVFLLLAVVLAKFYVPAPAGEFDAPRQTQTQQEPTPSADQPAPTADLEETLGDADNSTDVNSP